MRREDTPIFIPSLDNGASEPSVLPERSLVNSSWASIDLNDAQASARNVKAISPPHNTSRGEGILSTPLSFTPHEEVLRLGVAGCGLLVGSALLLAALLTYASGGATPLVIPGLAATAVAGVAALRVKALDSKIQAMAHEVAMGKAPSSSKDSQFSISLSILCKALLGCAALLPVTAFVVTIVLSLEFQRTQSRLVVSALALFDVMAGCCTWLLWDAASKLQEMGDKVDASSTTTTSATVGGDVEMAGTEESKQERSRQ